jgi:peptidoglycan/xylan/chitin deacetylase (PgdA/CDA1 family)
MNELLTEAYYFIKPFLPKELVLNVRRKYVRYKLRHCSDNWPINPAAGFSPPDWHGWPDKKQFALVLTHDVEGAVGLEKCSHLIDLEMQLGFRSSVNFVAEGYRQNGNIRQLLIENGFEVGLHGLTHNGNLFKSRMFFLQQVPKLRQYLKMMKSTGFRTPSMYHNLEWMHELDIKYDLSTFDTDPFEPQSDGVGTIFPFWVPNKCNDTGYVELPYTLPQDFTVFILLQERDTQIWQKKLDWIVRNGGMALLNTHPDYMNFGEKKLAMSEYPASLYRNFLMYVKDNYKDQYWHILPGQLTDFWRNEYIVRTEKVLERQSVASQPSF